MDQEAAFSERGLFWWSDDKIPADAFAPPESRFGSLTIDTSGVANLELDGLLGGVSVIFGHVKPELDLPNKSIVGKLRNSGQYCVLSKLRPNGGRLGGTNLSFERWQAHQTIITPILDSANKVEGVYFPLNDYREWLWLRSIRVEGNRNDFKLSYECPPADQFPLVDGELTVVYECRFPTFGKQTSEFSAIEEAEIVRTFSNAISVFEAIKEYERICDFFRLITGVHGQFPWPTIKLSTTQRATVYYSRFEAAPVKYERREAWLSYGQIRDNLGCLYSQFVEHQTQLDTTFYLFLSNLRGLQVYTEHKFIGLIWGLEALHRQQHRDCQPVGNEGAKIQEKVDRILSQIERERDKKWARKILIRAADMSLEHRLRDILEVLPVDYTRSNFLKFTKDCADKRNSISHHGGVRPGEDYSDFAEDLAMRTNVLMVLYRATLLKLIGVSDLFIKRYFDEGPKSCWIAEVFGHFELVKSAKAVDDQ